ncbi:MAG: hypothetical protein JXP36_03840 [Bacteroidales bacterium]|nr:hypothetical protein [Bacteroidales bacterium]
MAASVILQAYRTEGELSEMLADIITDMREDGKLDNENIATNLINQAVLLEIEEIKQNLVARYAELETVVTAPDFETLLSSFIENSGFTPVGEISYPTSARYGQNILNDALDTITAWGFYSMAAELPAGNSLHIKISGATWAYEVMPDAPINWTSDDFSFETMSQNFYSVTKGLDCNLKIQFFHNDDKVEEGEDITIEYFENASETATHTRQVHINFAPPV